MALPESLIACQQLSSDQVTWLGEQRVRFGPAFLGAGFDTARSIADANNKVRPRPLFSLDPFSRLVWQPQSWFKPSFLYKTGLTVVRAWSYLVSGPPPLLQPANAVNKISDEQCE
jgi:hypothetical protein